MPRSATRHTSSVVLARTSHHDSLLPLWTSPLCRSFTVVGDDSLSADTIQLQLMHVLYQTAMVPVLPTSLPPHVRDALALVPSDDGALLWRVVRAPRDWTVQRVAAAFGITRRSLERKHQQWGLPSPSELLQVATTATETAWLGMTSRHETRDTRHETRDTSEEHREEQCV